MTEEEKIKQLRLLVIMNEIDVLAAKIKLDWTDPRAKCANIADLCERARELIQGVSRDKTVMDQEAYLLDKET